MVDFSTLKSKSGKASVAELTEAFNKKAGGNNPKNENNDDPRFWQPTADKAGNGYAVIRFMPPIGEETDKYVKTYSHGFQGPSGKWYIEKSLTTINKKDPVTDFNNKLYAANKDKASPEQIQARNQKRKLHYISNIYVVSDSGNPENNGKSFLYKYGAQVFNKIKEAILPEFDEEGNPANLENGDANPKYSPQNTFDPFDLWHGANFKVKVRKVDGYRNLDKSEFAMCAPLFDDDDKMAEVHARGYALAEFTDPANFKTYEELQKRFNEVLGLDESTSSVMDEQDEPKVTAPKAQKSKAAPKIKAVEEDEDDDDDLAVFRKMASET